MRNIFWIILAFAWAIPLHAEDKELRLGTEGSYFPFNYFDEKGELKGFDIDVGMAICAEMKVKCKYVSQDWDGIIPGLLARKYDAIVASMTETPERKRHVAFTKPYYNTPTYFVAPLAAKLITTPEGLKGKTIGVQRGTVAAVYLDKKLKGVVNVKSYDTQDNVNLDLASGRIDAILADAAVMDAWLKQSGKGKFGFVGEDLDKAHPEIFGNGVTIAVRKEDNELRGSFDKAIDAIRSNGTLDKIRKKYFNFDFKKL